MRRSAFGSQKAATESASGDDQSSYSFRQFPMAGGFSLLDKSPMSLLCTKYFLDHGADLDMWQSLWFEGAPPREPFGQGIKDFVTPDGRNARRNLVKSFWQD